jgi:hypothetical protein
MGLMLDLAMGFGVESGYGPDINTFVGSGYGLDVGSNVDAGSLWAWWIWCWRGQGSDDAHVESSLVG